MKKTSLAFSIAAMLVLILHGAASAQQVKYTVEQTNLIEIKQTQNGWQKKEPLYVNTPPQQPQKPKRTMAQPAPHGGPPNGSPSLPSVKAPLSQQYLLNRGSGKTRKGSRSPDEVPGLQNAAGGGAAKPANSAPPAANNQPVRTPAKVRNVYSTQPKAWTTGTKRVTWTEDLGRKQPVKKSKPKSPQQSTDYAASYGAYDPHAKKKRNY